MLRNSSSLQSARISVNNNCFAMQNAHIYLGLRESDFMAIAKYFPEVKMIIMSITLSVIDFTASVTWAL